MRLSPKHASFRSKHSSSAGIDAEHATNSSTKSIKLTIALGGSLWRILDELLRLRNRAGADEKHFREIKRLVYARFLAPV
jgi:hypothetical protein